MSFRVEDNGEQIAVFRDDLDEAVLTQHAAAGHRPFLHPIVAPDGVGELTEFSPGHHPHQTGLYWGFTRVNGTEMDSDLLSEWFYKKDKPADIARQVGRDFFQNPGQTHWRKKASQAHGV